MSLFQFEGLGTGWVIETKTPLADRIAMAILARVRAFEADYSRFRPDSKLGILNDSKQLAHPSEEFIAMLTYALSVYEQSDGLFNISAGGILEQLGYGTQKDAQAKLSETLQKDIHISPDQITITDKIRLDFGGFGKGWMIDLIGEILASNDVKDFIVNGGGDILVGSGAKQLFIEHPLDTSLHIGSIHVTEGSLASSSRQKRAWKTPSGELRNHIVETKTAAPHDILSIHVRAASALEADTWATILLLIPLEQRLIYATQHHLEFLEIRSDLSFYQTENFGFVSN